VFALRGSTLTGGSATGTKDKISAGATPKREMDGFGLMREIRALGPDAGGSVPIVAMTAV
jgi:hypothetical protein